MLHYLVTHPDRLVTKDELLDAVWPNTAVTDAVVRVAIGAVRKALGETAQTPRCIATVPRRGYRFLAAVTLGEPSAPATPGPIAVSHVVSPTSLGTQGSPSPATLGGERKQVTVLVGEIPATLALLRDRGRRSRPTAGGACPAGDDGCGTPLRRHGASGAGDGAPRPVWCPAGP